MLCLIYCRLMRAGGVVCAEGNLDSSLQIMFNFKNKLLSWCFYFLEHLDNELIQGTGASLINIAAISTRPLIDT